MGGKQQSTEEMVNKLRQADVELGNENTVVGVCKLLEVRQSTYCRWRKEHGAMKVDQTKQCRKLAQEDLRLKPLLAEAELDL